MKQRLAGVLTRAAAALVKSPRAYDATNSLFAGELGGFNLGNVKLSVDSLFSLWRNNVDLSAAIRNISETVGVAGYEWIDDAGEVVDANDAQVREAERVLNAYGSFRRLKSQMVQHQEIAGNTYAFIERNTAGKALGIKVIHPRTMFVVTDKYGAVLKWIQRVGADTVDFKPEEILHWVSQPDPNSPVFGLSPIEPLVWEVKSDMAAVAMNYAFFENSAVPAAHYILDPDLTDTETQKVLDQINNVLRGAENQHKSMAIKGVKEIKTLSISQRDAEWLGGRRMTTKKVCAATGVPEAILGYTDDANYSNNVEQAQKYWEGTITPRQEGYAEFINLQVLPALKITGRRIRYKVRSFDNREWDEASTREDLKLGIKTINQVRERRGDEPYDASMDPEGLADRPLIFAPGVQLLDDVGVNSAEPLPIDMTQDQAAAEVRRIKELSKRGSHAKGKKNTDGK